MKLFMHRPLCMGCFAALAAALIMARTGLAVSAVLCGVFAAAAPVFAFAVKRGRVYSLTVCASVFLVALSFVILYAGHTAVTTDKQVTVHGYVAASTSQSYTKIVKITDVDGARADINAVVSFYNHPLYDFDEFDAVAVITKYSGRSEEYYKSEGAFFKADITNLEITGVHKDIFSAASAVRRFAERALYRVSDNAGILCRMFLGSSRTAPSGFMADMRSLGISHLLAVSGLHVTALLAGFDVILKRLVGNLPPKFILLSVAAGLYALMTGMSGSVMRAALMYMIYSVCEITQRYRDPPTALSLAGALIVLFDPVSALDVGFLLSFSATLGIITVGSPLSVLIFKKVPRFKKLLSGVAVTVCAILFTLPVAAFSYGKLTYGAIFYNIIASPIVSVLLYLCPYLILLSPVPYVGRGLGIMCDGLCEVLSVSAWFLSSHNVPSVSLRYSFVVPLLCALLAAVIILSFRTKKLLPYIAAILCFAAVFSVCCCVYYFAETSKDAVIISSGAHGACAAITVSGRCVIFDFTDGNYESFYTLADALLRRGVTRCGIVLAKGGGMRNIQSAANFCEYFDVDAVYVDEELSDAAEKLLKINILPYNGYEDIGIKLVYTDDGIISVRGHTLPVNGTDKEQLRLVYIPK